MKTQKIILLGFLFLLNSVITTAQTGSGFETLDINNIEAGFQPDGIFFNGVGYRVPKTDSTITISAGALWMGGVDAGGQLKLAAETYRQTGRDFWAGPIDSIANPDSTSIISWTKIWKVNQLQIDQHKADFNNNGIINIPQPAIYDWPGKGNVFAKGKGGVSLTLLHDAAPFVDLNTNAIYEPNLGEYPDIKGDQMLWYVFNDVGGIHTETGAQAIGAEIQISVYGFNCPGDDILYNTLFINYKIISRASLPLHEFYIGKWIDFDLGCFYNDYVGCDTASNTFYVYNGTVTDSMDTVCVGYGSNPPIQTVTFLNQHMTAFMYYNNDFTITGNPESAIHYYNYLKALWKDGWPLFVECDAYAGSDTTTFIFPGNPSDSLFPYSWSECSCNNVSADRRGLGAIGPFTFNPGQTTDMTLAFSTHFLPFNGCPDFTPYRQRIDSIQYKFNNNLLHGCDTLTLAVADADIEQRVSIYPNPARNVLHIEAPSQLKMQTLKIFDSIGKEIFRIEKPEQKIYISTENFPGGIYFLEISGEQGNSVYKVSIVR